MPISVKRVYDNPENADGVRVLVDRLWPRGLTKEAASVDLWLKDAAPSNELRKAFHADEITFAEFTKRYKAELRANADALGPVLEHLRARKTVTLLFASKSVEQNHAHVMKGVLDAELK